MRGERYDPRHNRIRAVLRGVFFNADDGSVIMFLLMRENAGFTSYLGVFDTLEGAKSYERRCLKCHAQGAYVYEIRRVAYNV